MNNQELLLSGIEALNRALGAHGALRFLTLLHWEPTDYVRTSRRLYKGQTVDEIYDRAKRSWSKRR